MRAALYGRLMIRESRGSGGRLAFFVACLAAGVAVVVAVAGLASAVDEGMRSSARELLAADISVEGMRPLPPEMARAMESLPGSLRADVRVFATSVASGGGLSRGTSRLARLKVVEGEYPFYGVLETTPDGPLDRLLRDDSAVVAEELLGSLGLHAGEPIRIGGETFTVAASLQKEPDRLDVGFSSLAPRVFISPGGLARTGLEARGSRILYRALVKLAPGSGAEEVREAAETIRSTLPDSEHLNIETYAEAQPSLRTGLKRAERFLGLVALLSLLIGGIGVGQTVRAWLAGRVNTLAIMGCLGVRPREVMALYVGQTALLGLAGSLTGAVVGTGLLATAPFFLAGIVPVEVIRTWQPLALARGVVLGVGVATLFSLPSLLSIRRVPPVRVFRSDAEALAAPWPLRAATGAALAAGIFTTALVQSGSPVVAVWFTMGLLAAAGLLALAAWLITRAVARFPRRRGGVWLRHGLAALGRPGAGTVSAVVALGVGVVVVLGMYLIETRLGDELEADLPDDAPSAFVINIQPDQWEEVRAFFEAEGAARVDSVPLVNARIVSVDGTPISELLDQESDRQRRRWVLTREQRHTWMEALPEGNEIVEGKLWSEPGVPEVSIERDFAEDMGAKVGSRVVVDVQGVPLELAVTSIRTVEWETFGINFFLVVEPGVLDNAPHSRLASVRLPGQSGQATQDRMAARFPNLTMIPIRDVLDRIVAILHQAGLGIRILGSFTVAAGIFILAGAVSAGSIRRGREVALMKTLGMTRGGVVAVYSVEYALIGLTAGLIGVAGAGILAWAVLDRWMEIEAEFTAAPFAAAAAATVLLAIGSGLSASLSALRRRPVEVLRAD